jgi:uncharacterized membrane protein
MNRFKTFSTYIFAVILILGGLAHFFSPEVYYPFFPDSLPRDFLLYSSGLVEILLGIGALTKKYRHYSTVGILALMVVFLPLHFADVFSDAPAIGSHEAALIRLPIQLFLILWAWYNSRKTKKLIQNESAF